MNMLFKLWHIVATTGQSKARVYLATLSSGHNLIKTDDIVREHIKHDKVKTLHKLCAYSRRWIWSHNWNNGQHSHSSGGAAVPAKVIEKVQLGLQRVMNYGTKLHSLGVAASSWTHIFLKLCLKIPDAAERLAILALHPASLSVWVRLDEFERTCFKSIVYSDDCRCAAAKLSSANTLPYMSESYEC